MICSVILIVTTASRKGGARIERELIGDRLVIHNYGAGGTGYQASWYEILA